MQDNDDITLLKQYAEGDEYAFTVLVNRYINLVYSTALRQVCNPSQAEEITQAVLIILTRKAKSFSPKTILSGWLYQTATLTAANFQRSEIRRQHREQEAFMQSTLTESDTASWEHIAPLLDEAMGRLGEADRNAIVLRFVENKTPQEVATTLKLNEVSARKRVSRAVEKLRKFFLKRGVTLSGAAIAGAVSANSVHAAPVGLAAAISTITVTKGAAASASTLTLVKGALKAMAWIKVKSAVVIGVGLLIVAGTTIATVKVIQNSSSDALWDTGINFSKTLPNAPHIVKIIPTKFPTMGLVLADGGDRTIYGTSSSLSTIIKTAYDGSDWRTIYLTALTQEKFDYIANLPSGSKEALRQKIKDQFGIVGRFTTIETNVFFLKVQSTNAPGLTARNRPSKTTETAVAPSAAGTHASKGPVYSKNILGFTFASVRLHPFLAQIYSGNIVGYVNVSPPPQTNQPNQTFTNTNQSHQTFTEDQFHLTHPISSLAAFIETKMKIPVIDQTKLTQLTNSFNIQLHLAVFGRMHVMLVDDPQHEKLKQALSEAGLELVPGTAPVEMLVVEKVK